MKPLGRPLSVIQEPPSEDADVQSMSLYSHKQLPFKKILQIAICGS